MTVATATPAPTRSHAVRWIAVGLAVVALALLTVLALGDPAGDRIAHSPLLGQPAPEVIGPGLDGSTVRLSQHRGRYVVLNFFASWCVPCQREHDDLLRFSERHRAAGDAAVVAVIFDDEPDRVRRWFEQKGGSWPVLSDARGKVALDFGVRGPPESFVIGPDGVVLAKVTGEVTETGLEKILRDAEARRSA